MSNRQGFLLITVLFVLLVVSLLAFGSSFTALVDRRTAATQRVGTEAYYVAQAGADLIKTGLFLTLADGFAGGAQVNACGVPGSEEIDFGEFTLQRGVPQRVEFGGESAILSYTVDGTYFILTSIGEVGGAQSTVRVVATAGVGPEGVWDNAIYASTFSGSTGTGAVAGKAAVYGSMHVVEGAVVVEDDVLGLIGTAGVFNNYGGKGQGDATSADSVAQGSLGTARITALTDLCSRVKIKSGTVTVQGTASLGATDGGSRIGALEGVYLDPKSELIIGNSEYDSETNYANVHLRSGVSAYGSVFDLQFPEMPAKPSERSLSTANCSQIVSGSKASLPPVGSPPNSVFQGTFQCLATDGSRLLSWTSTGRDTGLLTLHGDVAFDGLDLEFRKNSPLTYDGWGTFFVDGRVDVDDEVRASDAISYLSSQGLGVIANGEIALDKNGTLDMLLYSNTRILVQKQVAVVGALVGREVITAQVPQVLWHPDVSTAAKQLRMPGSETPGNQGFLDAISTARE